MIHRMFRTDSHNSPTAFTTDVAHEAGLVLGTDYAQGDPFQAGSLTLHTARILGDPIATTIRVIDRLSFVTITGISRWVYITMPKMTWDGLTPDSKRDVIGWMYRHEGGIAMRGLFPNYSKA